MLLARANARARRPPSEPRESLPCPDVREYVARQYVKHSKFKKTPPSLQDPINPQRTGGSFHWHKCQTAFTYSQSLCKELYLNR